MKRISIATSKQRLRKGWRHIRGCRLFLSCVTCSWLASAKAVESFFPSIKAGKWSFKARSIRGWTAEYLMTGLLKKYQQGLFIKTSSVVTDENVQTVLLSFLRELNDEDRHPESLRNYCNDKLFKEIPNAPASISLRTAARWLRYLGFKPKLQTKGFYTDGHNRQNVTVRMSSYLPWRNMRRE